MNPYRDRILGLPERGMESIGILVRMLAGHDLNHLSQLEQIAAQ